VTDELLAHAFSKFKSLQKTKIVRDKFTNKTKGFGFVSFSDPYDCVQAIREVNGTYIGNRPCKLSKSNWQDRNIKEARGKKKKQKKVADPTV
jgi:RNA recognition motif-containing protein